MNYIECLLPFSSSLKSKEVLINHDGEIKEIVCILLWQYIVTLEHGTHFHMHFNTWVIRLYSSPVNSINTPFEIVDLEARQSSRRVPFL